MENRANAHEEVPFKHSAAGLRVRKGSSPSDTTEYTLNGKRIVHLKRTPIAGDPSQAPAEMHFWYDAKGKPVMVNARVCSWRPE